MVFWGDAGRWLPSRRRRRRTPRASGSGARFEVAGGHQAPTSGPPSASTAALPPRTTTPGPASASTDLLRAIPSPCFRRLPIWAPPPPGFVVAVSSSPPRAPSPRPFRLLSKENLSPPCLRHNPHCARGHSRQTPLIPSSNPFSDHSRSLPLVAGGGDGEGFGQFRLGFHVGVVSKIKEILCLAFSSNFWC